MKILLSRPSPADCRALRQSLGLTLDAMASLAGLAHRQRWIEYEAGKMSPDAYRWTVLMLELDRHPEVRVISR